MEMFQIRIRVIVGIMIFLGYFLMYIVRYNLSVHIVDMAHVTEIEKDENADDHTIKPLSQILKSGINWDYMKMASLFSAYHIGYFICFPLFHNFADKIGPTWVVGIAGITSGVLNCLTPPSTYYNFWALFVVRIMKGFCAGAMQPSMVQVLRNWVPPVERHHFMWACCGITLGTFSTFTFCAAVHYYSQWPIGFYIIGGVQMIWSIIWISVVTDTPGLHSCISKDEQTYLTTSIGTVFTIQVTNYNAPWRLIMKSKAFWALCILNYGYAWMITSLCLHGPLYYSVIIKHSIYRASYLTALPFLLRLILGSIMIQTVYWFNHSDVRRIKHLRKYLVLASHVVPGLIICATWLFHIFPGPILLTLALALTSAGIESTYEICYELSPNFGISVFTVIKIMGSTPGIIISHAVGFVTQTYDSTPIVWKHIWCFHASVLLVSGIIFLIWGETHKQPWNLERSRPACKTHPRPKPSVMSNIYEIDEVESVPRVSYQFKRKSIYGPLKLSALSQNKIDEN